jgi:hypothetical protein
MNVLSIHFLGLRIINYKVQGGFSTRQTCIIGFPFAIKSHFKASSSLENDQSKERLVKYDEPNCLTLPPILIYTVL